MLTKLLRSIYHKLKFAKNKIKFKNDLKKFVQLRKERKNEFSSLPLSIFPCLNEDTEYTEFDAHYFYHPAWAIRKVLQINPSLHIDIGSILYFSGMLSSIIPVQYYDYRPAQINLSNFISGRADLLSLHFEDNSVESLSCMHTIEHIGLGRYGDPINPSGDTLAIHELKRVVRPGGTLLFVVPIGAPKIFFNAHRIYSYDQVLNFFPGFLLQEYALVTDDRKFLINATKRESDLQNYGCGCFWFIKK